MSSIENMPVSDNTNTANTTTNADNTTNVNTNRHSDTQETHATNNTSSVYTGMKHAGIQVYFIKSLFLLFTDKYIDNLPHAVEDFDNDKSRCK